MTKKTLVFRVLNNTMYTIITYLAFDSFLILPTSSFQELCGLNLKMWAEVEIKERVYIWPSICTVTELYIQLENRKWATNVCHLLRQIDDL